MLPQGNTSLYYIYTLQDSRMVVILIYSHTILLLPTFVRLFKYKIIKFSISYSKLNSNIKKNYHHISN